MREIARRRFLAGLGAGAVAGLASACAPSLPAAPLPAGQPDRSAREKLVRFANWPDYIDVSPGGVHRTLAEFTRRTAIKVAYSEPVTSNDKFLGQLGIPLALGRDPGYDLVVLTDWAVAQMIGLGWVEPLSPRLTPNASRLLPAFRDWPVPDSRRYCLPWQGGFTGIGYNERITRRPVTSMTDLLTSADLHGKVSLTTDFRDVVGLVLLDMDVDPADFGPAEFAAALDRIGRAFGRGQIKAISDEYYLGLAKGTLAAGVAWAGDVLFVQEDGAPVRFTWPDGGGMLWSDNMFVPARARHAANAERLMDFYYELLPAAQLAIYNRYICPVVGAQPVVRGIDPAVAAEPYVFPSPGLLASGHFFKLLSSAQSVAYSRDYLNTVGL